MSTTATHQTAATEIAIDCELLRFIICAARNEHSGETASDLDVETLDLDGVNVLVAGGPIVTHGHHLYVRCEIRCRVAGEVEDRVIVVDIRQRYLGVLQMAHDLHVGGSSMRELGLV